MESPQPRPRIAFTAVALLLGLGIALALAELMVRWTGHGPWRELDFDLGMPRLHAPDPELGWVNEPGPHVFGTPPIHMTFWADHTRATAPAPVEGGGSIVVLGCSFVQGWALGDADTFAWKLQERFPRARVFNYGTAGYGTTQALLGLQRHLATRPPRPNGAGAAPFLVVYGFSDFHADRAVASAPWLRTLAQLASRGHVATPYATLRDDGSAELHPPITYPAWWLHEDLATVAFLEERWAAIAARARTAEATRVTQRLLVELDEVVRASGGTLLVALLSEFQRGGMQPYRSTLLEHRISTAECMHPGVWSPAMQVPVYGHPNAVINAHWAGCIERVVGRMAPQLTANGDA